MANGRPMADSKNQEGSNPMNAPGNDNPAIALRAFQLWAQDGQAKVSCESYWLQAATEMKNAASTKPNAQIGRRAKRGTKPHQL